MFKTLRPERVYVTEDVYDDPRSAARVERMMTSIEPDVPLQRVRYEELNEMASQRWRSIPRWGANPHPRDPDIMLTTGKFWPQEQKRRFAERHPNLRQYDLLGFNTHHFRSDGELDWRDERRGIICHSAWELHCIRGCPFRCVYCPFGGVIRIFVNLEAYMEHVPEILALAPNQRLYKWDNQTDVSAFEPEWGASKLLVEYFAEHPTKYLEIYIGKSDNTDPLLDLDPRGHIILQWSVGARTQSTVLEPETASWDRRIEAARGCQEAGYIVRFRFSPIVPVRNWKEENAELIERIFARTKPDVISLCAFGWMSLEEAKACIDFDLLDPQYVAAMEAAAPFISARGFTSGGGRPIPHDARAYMFKFLIDEIRKHHRTVPISLCLETVEMWALFERELGMPMNPYKKSSYYCNCGGWCTPEHPLSKGVKPGTSWFGP